MGTAELEMDVEMSDEDIYEALDVTTTTTTVKMTTSSASSAYSTITLHTLLTLAAALLFNM